MTNDEQPNANVLVAEAISLSQVQRQAFIEKLQYSRPKIAAEVVQLLASHDAAEGEGFLLAGGRFGGLFVSPIAETLAADVQPTDKDATQEVSPGTKHPGDNPVFTGVPSELVAGEYELIDELGAGGMGTVYRAYQRSLNRQVALKIISSHLLRSGEQVARFYLEAEAAASLDHPGIVPVFDVGEAGGVHYYAMALVEGGSLAQHVGEGVRLSHRRATEILEQAARAVQHAHDRAVIHRDIKPANILLDPEGHPHITDFGLAKIVGGDELTMTGQVMGTPSYMAPEQAEGKNHAISTRADVYSLGATLYALLSGRPPFAADTVLDTLRQVQNETPAKLGNAIPLDLRTICEKCLAKQPDQRYATSAALAADLKNFLDGFPIAARPVGPWLRTVRWARRNPLVASLLGTIATILVVASIVSTTLAVRTQQALERADAHAQKLGKAIEETFVFASEGVLANEPGMQAARKTLLESAERYYQGLLETGHSSQKDLANASYLLGKVQTSLGQWQVAGESLSRALALQKQLVESTKGDAELYTSIALTHNKLAKLAETRWNRDTSDATQQQQAAMLSTWREHAEQCVFWRTKTVAANPSDDEAKRLLANAEMNQGWAIAEAARADEDMQQLAAAHKMLQTAQTIRKEILSRRPKAYAVSRDLALGLVAEADLTDIKAESAESTQQTAEATKLWQRSLALRTQAAKILQALPSTERTPETQWRLATCYQVCGDSRFRLGLFDEAIADFRQMLAVLERLMLRNPNVIRYRTSAAAAQFNLSQLLLASGDERGYAMIADFQQSLTEAIAIAPEIPATLDQLIGYTSGLAESLAESGLASIAQQQIEQAIKLLETLPTDDPSFDVAARQRLSAAIKRLQKLAKRLAGKRGPNTA